MKISVIIPTFNRRHVLARTLPCLLGQDFPPEDYEIVIVVDGSTDGTAEMIRSIASPCRLVVIEQHRQGAAVARNAGAAAACGSLLLFLDDDILCGQSLIGEHFRAQCRHEANVTHGPIFVAPESPPTLVAQATMRWYKAHYRQFTPEVSLDVYRHGFLISNSCMRRELFLSCGGFDPEMFLLEDTELGVRLTKAGVRFTFLTRAVVYELFSKSTWAFINHDGTRQGRAEIILCRKHPEYRRFSALSNLGGTTLTRRVFRWLLLRSALNLQPLLALPLWVLERLSSFDGCRTAGLFLLGICHRLAFLRSAVYEAGSYRALMRQYGIRVPVLLYHNVGPARWTRFPGLTISPERFKRQMRWLSARNYSTIGSSDWIAWVTKGVPLPPKPVLLTFDDGYADLTVHAFPLLQQLGFTAEVFIVTRLVGGTNSWDHNGQRGTLSLMTHNDIKTWSRHGISFGAHSRTHPNLAELSAPDVEDQIEGSARDLAETTGQIPVVFAYPYGQYNPMVKACVRRHFQAAHSVEDGFTKLDVDLFELRRIWIPPDRALADFACRVCIGWGPIGELRSFLRIRTRAKRIMHMGSGPH